MKSEFFLVALLCFGCNVPTGEREAAEDCRFQTWNDSELTDSFKFTYGGNVLGCEAAIDSLPDSLNVCECAALGMLSALGDELSKIVDNESCNETCDVIDSDCWRDCTDIAVDQLARETD